MSLRPLSLLALSLLLAACTKSESGGSSGASTSSTGSTTPTTSTASTATASATASAAETATASVSAAPTASAPTTKAAGSGTAAASASAPAASGSAAAAECGTKPLPDCPLQAWMKANTNTAVTTNDLPALATALDKTASFAPAGYTNWATISKDGAKAARAGDMTAAKASCRTCHDQYKQKYKTEMRARKI